jgi:hypothetical protein
VCGCIDDHLARDTELVVAQDLFRSARVENRQGAELSRYGIDALAVKGRSGPPHLVLQSVDYGIGQRQAHPLAQPLRQSVGGGILDAEDTRLSLPHEVIVRQSQGYDRALAYFFVPNNTLTLVSPFSVPTVTTTVRFVAVSSAESMPPDALSVLPVMLAVIPKPACLRFCS